MDRVGVAVVEFPRAAGGTEDIDEPARGRLAGVAGAGADASLATWSTRIALTEFAGLQAVRAKRAAPTEPTQMREAEMRKGCIAF
jgi:hypothetical protein